jgi:hypothetical protein
MACAPASPLARAQTLQYDLRFDDGSKTRQPSVGNHTVQLFARVNGNDTDHTNEGMGWSYVTLSSQQLGGGAVTGGIASGTRIYPFNLVGHDGTGSDLNGDGFGDWGSTSTDAGDDAYMFAHVATIPTSYYAAGSDVGVAIDEHTWEFPIASFVVNVTGTSGNSGAQTRLEIIPPSFATTVFGPYYATYRHDGDLVGLIDPPYAGVYGSFVSFAVPEPAGVSFAALGLAMLTRPIRARSKGEKA